MLCGATCCKSLAKNRNSTQQYATARNSTQQHATARNSTQQPATACNCIASSLLGKNVKPGSQPYDCYASVASVFPGLVATTAGAGADASAGLGVSSSSGVLVIRTTADGFFLGWGGIPPIPIIRAITNIRTKMMMNTQPISLLLLSLYSPNESGYTPGKKSALGEITLWLGTSFRLWYVCGGCWRNRTPGSIGWDHHHSEPQWCIAA